PRALGGDLGCGMSALRTSIGADALARTTLRNIVAALEKAIPAGSELHRGKGVGVPDSLFSDPLSTNALDHARAALASRHLGTLGGGNHFLELDRDAEGQVWMLVHSGSRGLGAAVAAHHVKATGDTNALAGIDCHEREGEAYLRDHAWALTFARANRRALATKAAEIVGDVLHASFDIDEPIDVHHNFVARERWNGRDLLVHRKGAIAAPAGALALVPGSMGTASYVVEGLGNPASFGSCSHGAGRVLTRTEARKTIGTEALARAMRNVVHPEALARKLVEEAPAAYRDIVEVLDHQRDLVKKRTRLEPIAVLKG
ncbi:MAG TPA: RtcB family protein, partial [Polyangiaceae bacterium]